VAAEDRQDGLPVVLPLPVAVPPLAFTISVLQGVWALSTLPQPGSDSENQVREAGINVLARRMAAEAVALGQLAQREA